MKRYGLGLSLGLMISGVLAISMSVTAQEEHEDMAAYEVILTAEPQVPSAEEAFRLSLQILQDGTPVQDFDIAHEKLLHLIIVSEDLQEFLHVHPEYQGNGVFVLDDVVLPKPANYVLFADFTPTGSTQQAVRIELPTDGAETSPAALTVSALETTDGPLSFHLQIPEQLKAGETVTLSFHVTDATTGEPVSTLDEYLGAAGHLVILDQAAETYLHTHPEHDEDAHAGHHETPAYGPEIEFMTQFPATGTYALWLQVQYQGEIYTAPFVIEVTEQAEVTQEPHHH
jgi:hypothetical protein